MLFISRALQQGPGRAIFEKLRLFPDAFGRRPGETGAPEFP
jgi:hypothetical protein